MQVDGDPIDLETKSNMQMIRSAYTGVEYQWARQFGGRATANRFGSSGERLTIGGFGIAKGADLSTAEKIEFQLKTLNEEGEYDNHIFCFDDEGLLLALEYSGNKNGFIFDRRQSEEGKDEALKKFNTLSPIVLAVLDENLTEMPYELMSTAEKFGYQINRIREIISNMQVKTISKNGGALSALLTDANMEFIEVQVKNSTVDMSTVSVMAMDDAELIIYKDGIDLIVNKVYMENGMDKSVQFLIKDNEIFIYREGDVDYNIDKQSGESIIKSQAAKLFYKGIYVNPVMESDLTENEANAKALALLESLIDPSDLDFS